MKNLSVFNHITLDGFFAGPNDEIDWFQAVHDDEWNRYAQEHANLSHNTLMFGHTTYKMMKSWWPTQAAIKADPAMAFVMNHSPKIVFSKRLKKAQEGPNWENISVFDRIDLAEIRNLKRNQDITILGSGTIVRQLTDLRLIDEYSLLLVPIVLGRGKPLFKDVGKTALNLVEDRRFKNGVVLLRYKPV
jgi:dihydrofolate reductase